MQPWKTFTTASASTDVVDFLNVSIDKGFISIEKTAATHPHINVIDANSSTASDLTPHFSGSTYNARPLPLPAIQTRNNRLCCGTVCYVWFLAPWIAVTWAFIYSENSITARSIFSVASSRSHDFHPCMAVAFKHTTGARHFPSIQRASRQQTQTHCLLFIQLRKKYRMA